jgi:hypothetical protein
MVSSWTSARHMLPANISKPQLSRVIRSMNIAKITQVYVSKSGPNSHVVAQLQDGQMSVLAVFDQNARPHAAFHLGKYINNFSVCIYRSYIAYKSNANNGSSDNQCGQ